MKYEEGLKRILGNSDIFWYNLINEFVESEYTDKDIALKDLEALAKNQERFKIFAKALTERKQDFAGVKKDYIDSITIEKENTKENNYDYKSHAKQLSIPILNGFKLENNLDKQTILFAQGNGYIEQLVSDGHIENNDFEKRIDLVINNTKNFMKANNCENVENSFKFYKDYTNGIFNFKIYICDLIIQGKVLRQFISYFVEPKLQDFYQLTVSVGPFDFPTNQIKIDQIDLNNDPTTKSLDILNTLLLNNLKYKE